jgi:hypothetical protein
MLLLLQSEEEILKSYTRLKNEKEGNMDVDARGVVLLKGHV